MESERAGQLQDLPIVGLWELQSGEPDFDWTMRVLNQAEPILTAPEMAAILGFKSADTVHAMRGRGEIPSFKKGKRWVFLQSEVFKKLKADQKHALESWRDCA